MMSYPRIVHAVFHHPWAIERSWLGTIFALLHSRIFADGAQIPAGLLAASAPATSVGAPRAGRFSVSRFARGRDGRLVNHTSRIRGLALSAAGSGEDFDEGAYDDVVRREEDALPAGQLLHVFASGIMGKHLSMMDEVCAGGLSVDRLQAALKLARDDDKVSAIMLHLDTPGGVSTGIPETSDLVRSVNEIKPVAAFSDSLTASAGYWTISNSRGIYATQSADLGSIGVYCAIVDYVGWCRKNGIAVDVIKDGTYKAAGYPGTSITPEQRALIEADVMDISALFKGSVRAGRDGVSDDTMQGQCFRGPHAVAARLADAIVPDLEAAMEDLATII